MLQHLICKQLYLCKQLYFCKWLYYQHRYPLPGYEGQQQLHAARQLIDFQFFKYWGYFFCVLKIILNPKLTSYDAYWLKLKLLGVNIEEIFLHLFIQNMYIGRLPNDKVNHHKRVT